MDFEEKCNQIERIKTICRFPKSRECFPGVDIAVVYSNFLWDRNYNGRCHFVSKIGGTANKSLRYLDEFEIVVRTILV
jgi:site-specific DNA-methyltransferase (adenine-specific)